MKSYRSVEWKKFYAEVIKLHENRCAKCLRSKSKDIILQVHHKQYIRGRDPWDYRYDECEVLCKGCHAKEHGIIIPSEGWDAVGQDDLGGLYGNCEYCGTALRYTHLIAHEKWPVIEVGIDCCDKLTASTEASTYNLEYTNRIRRRKNFIESSRWIGGTKIKQDGIYVVIIQRPDGKYINTLNGIQGQREHYSLLEAKMKIFDFIDSGKAHNYLLDRRRRSRENTQVIRTTTRPNP